MKTKTLLLIAFLSATTLLIARPGPPQGDGQRGPGPDIDKLNLSESQKQQFQHVMQLKDEKMKVAMEKIHNELQQELAKFLTQEQLQQLNESRQNMHNKAMHHKKMMDHHNCQRQ